ncbi:MAG: sporulation initiation factor Spo0A C-terminal domain-containing protein [Eubacteriales bacterium]|nr:sporulation initiation factor Spo0A C-terminal domain-containing protein [Eubacteriales bacterium]
MNVNEIIKQVAKVHNTTPEEVYAEMQIALDAAFQSKDPDVKKAWAKIPFQGERPTPEDVIPYLASQLKASQEAVS